MDRDRINVWTTTLYTLIHSLNLAKAVHFGNLPTLTRSVEEAATWVPKEVSYNSVLTSGPLGKRGVVTFRRDPNDHFGAIVGQVICMLVQDLVVIFDEMMERALMERGEQPGNFPRNKLDQLATRIEPRYTWAYQGCLELLAVRNVLTHSAGRWNDDAIAIISPFVTPAPRSGERLTIGFPMLFRYRKAIRIFLDHI
jgi:hypothetical protein